MLTKIFKALFRPKQYKIQTFTYYIPSPPERKSGYREKQFDKVFYEFINKGYEILSIQTETNNSSTQSGMWIICTVRAQNKDAEKLCFEEDLLKVDKIPQGKSEADCNDGEIYYFDNQGDY